MDELEIIGDQVRVIEDKLLIALVLVLMMTNTALAQGPFVPQHSDPHWQALPEPLKEEVSVYIESLTDDDLGQPCIWLRVFSGANLFEQPDPRHDNYI